MSRYASFGLQENKTATDQGSTGHIYCIFCNNHVTRAMPMCFSNWGICTDCSRAAAADPVHRWTHIEKPDNTCFKCNQSDKAAYTSHPDNISLYLCRDCVDLSNSILSPKIETPC